MEEKELTMQDLMDQIDQSMHRIYPGDIKEATVVTVTDEGVYTNIGYHADALIPWNEYAFEEVNKEDVQVGDRFDVLVVKIDDGEGNVLVSKRRAEAELAFEKIEDKFKNKEVLDVKIKQVVKGGFITSLEGQRAFIPASQLTDKYIENLDEYVGQTVQVQVIEFDPKKRKIVLSGKAIAKAKSLEAKKEKLQNLVEGEKYTGVVTKLMPYGAFVDLGGVDGLVHNTDLSWVRIKHPSDVVKEGDKVEVTVLSIDRENERISLRVKDIAMDPWYLETANLEVGRVVMGCVTKFMTFGAFVKITDTVEGLVHISEITDKRITKPEEVLEIGQEVKVKIVSIDKENKKIGLSIQAAIQELDTSMEEYVAEAEDTFGDASDAFKGLFS
jgi:small subunit ribosomal protein S1